MWKYKDNRKTNKVYDVTFFCHLRFSNFNFWSITYNDLQNSNDDETSEKSAATSSNLSKIDLNGK